MRKEPGSAYDKWNIYHERGKDREVLTTSGTYPCEYGKDREVLTTSETYSWSL